MALEKVFLAEPFAYGRLTASGDAHHMLLQQNAFPLHYDPAKGDELASADDDRLQHWYGVSHWRACRHQYIPQFGFEPHQAPPPDKMLAFIAAVMKEATVIWSGYRVLGTVDQMNGGRVITLELFLNRSGTKVYSEMQAPNVQGFKADWGRRALSKSGYYETSLV